MVKSFEQMREEYSREHRRKHKKIILLAVIALLVGIIGWVLPEINSSPITYINASNISYSGLTNVQGSLSNISEINNGNWSADETNTPFWINITFTNVTHFGFTEIKMLYFSTVGASTHVNDIEIFCVTEGNFVDLTTFTNQIEWFYWTRHIPDSMHFIQPNGNVTLRINHTANGNANHRIRLDVVRLIEQPKFERVNATITQYFNTTGAGCTGDCAFNNLTVNSIGKNDTSYSMFINLTSPLQHYLASQDIQNFIFMNESDGGISSMHFVSQNLTDGEHSEFFMSPYRFFWFNGNGGSRAMESTPAGIDMIINGTADYRFNQTHFDMGGANLTGCSNCIDGNSTVYLYNYTGTGNAYLCIDANGKIFRGNPGC